MTRRGVRSLPARPGGERCLLGRRAGHGRRRRALRGRVRLRQPGLARGNTLDTRFDTASITKLFTAVATLQQVDAGAFGLDTSAVGYLGLEGTAISPDVTVRHLLTHTSGIGDDADEEAGESYEAVWQTRPNYSVLETADFLPQFVHRAAELRARRGLPLQQLRLRAARPDGRAGDRPIVSRRRPGGRLRAGRHGRLGLPAHGPRQRAAGRGRRSDPRRRGHDHRLEAEHLLVPADRLARRRART